jgi:predicted enzyme related to lactoylglutathione lyase
VITGFDGVSLWSSDLQKLLPFYRDTLGFEVQLESPRFVILGGPGQGICIGSHSEVHGRPSDPNRWLLRITSDDIYADVARLKAAGVEFTEEPNDQGDGLWLATCKDPEGNLIQLNHWANGRPF